MTGIHSPYEIPENPEIILHTDRQSIAESVRILLEYVIREQNTEDGRQNGLRPL
jgi:adenylylsulfate kinase